MCQLTTSWISSSIPYFVPTILCGELLKSNVYIFICPDHDYIAIYRNPEKIKRMAYQKQVLQ